MEITIRKENRTDYNKVYDLVKAAFASAEHADGTEQDLVNRLRKSTNFIPNLSLVAEVKKEIVGHLLMTKIMIEGHNKKHEALALAPLSVLPSYQKQGIGSRLVKEGLKLARELGYNGVIVVGSEQYYPQFGFEEARKYHTIKLLTNEYYKVVKQSLGKKLSKVK